MKTRCSFNAILATAEAEGISLWNISGALEHLGERAQAIQNAEHALTIYEQIEDPNAAQVRAQLATWREQTNS